MCKCVNVEVQSYDNQVELPRPAHMKGQFGNQDTICVDTCIAEEIQVLWKSGISTTGCCCGHNRGPEFPFIGVVDADIEIMKAMGYKVQPNNCDLTRQDSFVPKTKL